MDEDDLKLLAAIFRRGGWRFSGWDPRISVREVADMADMAPTTAWERLQRWRETGLLEGFSVFPHPAFFDRKTTTLNVRLADMLDRADFVDEVASWEGVVAVVEHLGGWVSLAAYDRDREETLTRAEDVASRADVAEVDEPHLFGGSGPPARDPDLRDWRIIARLMEDPEVELAEVADHLGVSQRTVHRRYERLLADRIVLANVLIDFTRAQSVVANLILNLEDGLDPANVTLHVREIIPTILRFSPGIEDVEGNELAIWQGYAVFDNLAAVEQAALALRAIPGVEDVEVSHPLRFRAVTDWLERQVEAQLRDEA